MGGVLPVLPLEKTNASSTDPIHGVNATLQRFAVPSRLLKYSAQRLLVTATFVARGGTVAGLCAVVYLSFSALRRDHQSRGQYWLLPSTGEASGDDQGEIISIVQQAL